MTKQGLTEIVSSPGIILILASLVIAVLLFILFIKYLNSSSDSKAKIKGTKKTSNNDTTTTESEEQLSAKERKNSKKKASSDNRSQQRTKAAYSHPWLLTSLKAHCSSVLDLDFSSNKKYLATCAEDRTVMLWNVKDFTQKDHKFLRVNVDFDYATRVKWSPDSKAIILCRHTSGDLQVYKVNKKPDNSLSGANWYYTFPTKPKADIVGMGIASTGKYVMTCSADNTLVVWDLKGDVLASIDTHQVNVYYACVSPCGRFVASCGFTSDVKVWQVVFDKMGEFKEVSRAFELKGHTAGVESFAFNDDSSRMASVSKDKTWKLWDTKVEFDKCQEPYLLLTVPFQPQGVAIASISPDGRVVAIASGNAIRLFSAAKGHEEKVIDNQGAISCLAFDPFGKYLLAATDKHVRVYHNAVGYRIAIQELEERKKVASNPSMKERIQQQIQDARCALDAISEK